MPTEVQALSNGVGWWQVTTDNSIGSLCDENATMTPTVEQTMAPTVEQTIAPTPTWPALPTTMPIDETTAVNFNGQQYTGTVPSQFGLLTSLTVLNLGQNPDLTGTL